MDVVSPTSGEIYVKIPKLSHSCIIVDLSINDFVHLLIIHMPNTDKIHLQDMSGLVKDSFMVLIDMSLTSVESFKFDDLIDEFLRLFMVDSSEIVSKLLITDKFHLYKSF